MSHGFIRRIQTSLKAQAQQDQQHTSSVSPVVYGNTALTMSNDALRCAEPNPELPSRGVGKKRITPVEQNNQPGIPVRRPDILDEVQLNKLAKIADLGRFSEKAQPYILQAILDPTLMNPTHVTKVGRCVVERASQDTEIEYHSIAAEICLTVTMALLHGKKAYEDFIDAVVTECQLKLRQTLEVNQMSCWRNSILFAAGLHHQLSDWNVISPSLLSLIYSTMCWLAEDPQCFSSDHVRILLEVTQLTGKHVLVQSSAQEMGIFCQLLRDAFLQERITNAWPAEPAAVAQADRKRLLLLIELYTGNFDLSEEAKSFYCSQ